MQTGQNIALHDFFAFLHQQGRQNAALKVLDDLRA